jgi:hypothetical protein
MDVRKYFDSIHHGVLKGLLRRRFKDPVLLALLDGVINSYAASPDRGVPIGNLTSLESIEGSCPKEARTA